MRVADTSEERRVGGGDTEEGWFKFHYTGGLTEAPAVGATGSFINDGGASGKGEDIDGSWMATPPATPEPSMYENGHNASRQFTSTWTTFIH